MCFIRFLLKDINPLSATCCIYTTCPKAKPAVIEIEKGFAVKIIGILCTRFYINRYIL